ncbi:acyltransferase [Candidimonas sp. SYP-B2681]|uniref:acyltransferase family protein n=1 Tax=Candidimonas sp. SYP-B2681 TaxID=2497686 RepID=UPI000F878D28|nr:acyltransferase family protein [Candidimonas sp. SYP-B2681]RTZ42370.1 acyltransferase [Candidimonas sp. SYP-B2681]
MVTKQLSADFRLDINGLRGWAVIAVMLFHFNVPGFSGGFVGVDIFFVISGYLMTGIIIRGIDARQGLHGFSLVGFYFARARRILPALVVLCAVLLSIGWFTLAAVDYRSLGSHSASSLAFLSNIKYLYEASYFDAESHEKWLLHTWSLSVEWQFYLLLPLILLATWRFLPGRRNAAYVLSAMFAASLLLSIFLTPKSPSAAFYLFPIRAWEMLTGDLIYLLASALPLSSKSRRTSAGLGYTVIFGSILSLDPTMAWPGYLALLPVAGAALVLIGNSQESWLSQLSVTQRIGTWSYSIYLWHWPLAVALFYLDLQSQAWAILAGIAASILLGWMSYKFVEVRASKILSKMSPWRAIASIALVSAAVAVPAAYVRLNNGVAGRMAEPVEEASNAALDFDVRRAECEGWGGSNFASCVYGGTRIRAIVIGDSHANAVVTAAQAALPAKEDGILAFSYTSCPTILGVRNYQPQLECAAFNEWAIKQMETVAADVPVIIVNRLSDYVFGSSIPKNPTFHKPSVFFSRPYDRPLPEFLDEFRTNLVGSVCYLAGKRPVYQVRPIPEMPVHVPKALARSLILGQSRHVSVTLAEYHERHRFIWAGQNEAQSRCGARVLDPLPYLCPRGDCEGAISNKPLYYDDNHLSEYGNKLLIPMFRFVLFSAQKSFYLLNAGAAAQENRETRWQ